MNTVTLQHLADVRALFCDELKREPASDWFIDAEDALTHPGMTPADREASARALLLAASKTLKQVQPEHPMLLTLGQLALEAPK